jgi:hypothetical protein
MTDLADFAELVALDHGLCVISTRRTDGSAQSSVVNAGVIEHPLGDSQVVALDDLFQGVGPRRLAVVSRGGGFPRRRRGRP